MNIIDTALHYKHDLGLSVIPQKFKKALIPWAEYQNRQPSDEEIKKWWGEKPDAGIAAVTGSVSGVIVIDCDSQEAVDLMESLFPDNLTIPCVESPRGGRHYYLSCSDKIKKQVGWKEKVDLQAELSYIIMPPSIGENRKSYKWIVEPTTKNSFPAIPASLQASMQYINKESTLYRGNYEVEKHNLTNPYITYNILQEGRRDQDLFTVANALIKNKVDIHVTREVLEILAKNCNPPFPKDEVEVKIKSAIDRCHRRERNLTAEIREFVTLQEGYIDLTFLYTTLQILTKEEKNNAMVILNRLCKEGVLEKYGNKRGCYIPIREIEENIIDIEAANNASVPINFPLGISDLVKIMPKNIIIIAGESNAGKSAFLLNTAARNMLDHKVFYFSSEMGGAELKERLLNYKDQVPMHLWKECTFIERASDFHTVIRPDAINIIDFLEIHDEFYKIGGYIKQIFDKLDKGVAIIAIQKNKGRDDGLGGARSIEKARLYLSMQPGLIKIVKAKNWVSGMINPNGMQKQYKLAKGMIFKETSNWEHTNEN